MSAHLAKQWKIHRPSTESEAIARQFQISRYMAQLLVNRKLTRGHAIESFFSPKLSTLPEPSDFLGLDHATDRIYTAVIRNEKIAIHGDYDVDGISSTSLLYLFFKKIGYTSITYYLPDRAKDGYGFHIASVDYLAKFNVKLIITVDCGITAIEAVNHAKQLGIDTIITDHHELPDQLPDAHAIVNPKLDGHADQLRHLAGVGVAFYLIIALRKKFRDVGYFRTDRPEPNLREFLDLVALGSIADIVPVLGINRTLIHHGLKEIETNPRCGVAALKKVCSVRKNRVSYGSVGYLMAPRLNASGRLSHAGIAVELLTANDNDIAMSLAQKLNDENLRRQSIETQIFEDAIHRLTPTLQPAHRTICLVSPKWHPGVLGIVAARIVERFHRPTLLLSERDGLAQGSGRSIRGFNIYEALSQCKPYLTRFGGHAYAAGATLPMACFDRFKAAFESYASQILTDMDMIPTIYPDMSISLPEITPALLNDLKRLEPHGPKNPEPIFVTHGLSVINKRILKGQHIKLTVRDTRQTFEAIAFRMANRAEMIGTEIDIAYTPTISEFNGTRRIQLIVKDFRATK